MKKIIILLSFAVIGCVSTKNQEYPHYHPTPTITQGADDEAYWVPVVKVPPRYPMNALTSRIQGCAQIGYTITPDGTIADPFVIKSVPEGVFDRDSIAAALQFKYKPAATNTALEPVIGSNVFTFSTSADSYEKLSLQCK